MKLKNGKIGNINKKILAGALVLVLTTTALVGCNSSGVSFEYSKNEQGEYITTNNVEYKFVAKWVLCTIKLDSELSYYIAKPEEDFLGMNYYNVFGGQLIYDSYDKNSNLELINEEKIMDYLVVYDKVQKEYTEEELKEILNMYIENQEKDNTKQKIKE